MSVNTRVIHASPSQVWDVLSDGWLYPTWVVGATRMRKVEDTWPLAGAKLHHSIGVWPLALDDHTEVVASEPLHKLELLARGWPFFGEAQVVLELEPVADGTRVRMQEDAVSGPGKLVPSPLRQPLLTWRNVESLRRLAFIVEGRTAKSALVD
jgi:uncharacterized protein YndB with AHSA1/START domain